MGRIKNNINRKRTVAHNEERRRAETKPRRRRAKGNHCILSPVVNNSKMCFLYRGSLNVVNKKERDEADAFCLDARRRYGSAASARRAIVTWCLLCWLLFFDGSRHRELNSCRAFSEYFSDEREVCHIIGWLVGSAECDDDERIVAFGCAVCDGKGKVFFLIIIDRNKAWRERDV